ncbi:MAG: VWA domain-containing protein [Candidatus Brocadiia bacterium]|nr:MAG: VWA domain-containing protein [Candidatus Brocadiia bacterium]
MELYSPQALLLLLLMPVLAYLMLRKKRTAALKFPSMTDMKNCPVSWRLRLRPLLTVLRLLCVALLIVAIARPRKGTVLSEISTEGIAAEVVVDQSGSMETEMSYQGKKLTRLAVVKEVLKDFIEGDKKGFKGRGGDLIGLITFARFADTKCPLVHSHNDLVEFLKKTDIVKLDSENYTSIGDAIALAAARLKQAEEEIIQRKKQLGLGKDDDEAGDKIKSKIIILLTDGINNAGDYDPVQAAELAKEWGIKIYTIGIGSSEAFSTVTTPMGTFRMPARQELDERLLKNIADNTGGIYGRADDEEALREIVKKIDELEKTNVKSVQYTQYAERFGPWTIAALITLTSEILAGCTVFRKIP